VPDSRRKLGRSRSELHRDEKAVTVTGFVERGLEHFANRGIEAKRLMSDG
jgi:hypothetical protein